MFHSKLLVLVVVCAQVCLGAKYLKEQPDWLKKCEKGQKKYSDCSTISTQGLFKQVSVGIPEIGIPKLDPLKIDKIDIVQGEGPVNVDISLENVTVLGFSKMNVLFNTVDFEKRNFQTHIIIPKLRIEGYYKSKGRILIVPLNGDGDCWLEPKDLDINAVTDYTLIKKKKFNFYNVTNVNIDYKLGGLKLQLNNLFNGARELSEGTNEYLNKNWEAANEAFRPILKSTIEGILYSILYKLFHGIPADFFVSNILA